MPAHLQHQGLPGVLLPLRRRAEVLASEFIVPEIERQGGRPRPARPLSRLSGRDRHHARPRADAAGRFDFVFRQHDWGPGRVDTFNSAKVIFNFPMAHARPEGTRRPRRLPVDLAAAPAQAARRRRAHATALGRQQHHGRGAQQERRLRHRHDAADDRPRAPSSASRTGCSTSRRRAFRTFSRSTTALAATRRADLRRVLRQLPRRHRAAISPASTSAR